MRFSINYLVKNLCEVEVLKEFKIIKIESEQIAIKRRLLELGFLPGRKLRINRKSLSKKTILVEIGGYLLALRCAVAKCIFVE